MKQFYHIIWQGRLSFLRMLVLLMVAVLLAVGLSCFASLRDAGGADYFQRQINWILIGTASFLLMNVVNYRKLGKYSDLFFVITLILLAIVLTGKILINQGIIPPNNAFIPRINGSCRWLVPHPALRLQPSEFAKIGFIMMFAWYLRSREDHRRFIGLIKCFMLVAMPMILILLEPDLGTMLLFIPTFFAMLFTAGCRIKHIMIILLMAMISAPLIYTYGLQKYQKDRVAMFFKQNTTNQDWLRDEGYQLHHSKSAIALGGLWGQGEQGFYVQRPRALPHSHNDFIWSLVIHKWGIAGGLMVLLVYFIIVIAGYEIASLQTDAFGKLIAVGISTILAAQMVFNAAIAMGLVPPTGMTLPFVSYGGSSMLSSFMALGLLFNVGRHQQHQLMAKEAFVFED